jgi:hypothetical protein
MIPELVINQPLGFESLNTDGFQAGSPTREHAGDAK